MEQESRKPITMAIKPSLRKIAEEQIIPDVPGIDSLSRLLEYFIESYIKEHKGQICTDTSG